MLISGLIDNNSKIFFWFLESLLNYKPFPVTSEVIFKQLKNFVPGSKQAAYRQIKRVKDNLFWMLASERIFSIKRWVFVDLPIFSSKPDIDNVP